MGLLKDNIVIRLLFYNVLALELALDGVLNMFGCISIELKFMALIFFLEITASICGTCTQAHLS